MEIFSKPIEKLAIDTESTSMKKMENMHEHIFDNSTQDAIGQFYLTINFSGIPNKYKCITEIIDRVELGYYLKGKYNNAIKLTAIDLLFIYNNSADSRRCEILLKHMLNFDGMCYIPILFDHNNMFYLPTPKESPIKFTIRMISKVDITINIIYNKIFCDNQNYNDHYMQKFFVYERLELSTITETDVHALGYDGYMVKLDDSHNMLYVNPYLYPPNLGFPPEYIQIDDILFDIKKHFILTDGKPFRNYEVIAFKKKQLVFLNGYLLDDNGSKIIDEDDENIQFSVEI